MRNKVDFKLLLITDRKQCSKPLINVVETSCKLGIKVVQLREKDLSSKELLRLAVQLSKVTNRYGANLIINDRLDVVLLSKACGIHSPENGTPIKYMKKFANNLLIGKSVHSNESAVAAEKEGYDYLIYGPVFRTGSKIKYGKPKGIKGLKKVCNSVIVPVFAIGGISPERTLKCIKSGAYGVAVMSALMKSGDLKKTINGFKKALGEL